MILRCTAVANPEVIKRNDYFHQSQWSVSNCNKCTHSTVILISTYEIQDTVFYWSKDDVTFSGQVKTDKAEAVCDYDYDDNDMAECLEPSS